MNASGVMVVAVVGACGVVSVAVAVVVAVGVEWKPSNSLMIQRRDSIDERVIASANSIGCTWLFMVGVVLNSFSIHTPSTLSTENFLRVQKLLLIVTYLASCIESALLIHYVLMSRQWLPITRYKLP